MGDIVPDAGAGRLAPLVLPPVAFPDLAAAPERSAPAPRRCGCDPKGPAMSDRLTSLFSVAGKTALVTGGGRGIGYMISRGLVQAGVKVYISSRKADVIDKAAAERSELPGSAGGVPIVADLSRAEECDRLAAELTAHEPML